jgi:peptide chain release factor subunit 3
MTKRKFVLLGNVDHGKSTLAGQILVSIGEVDERELEKIKEEAQKKNMQSWYLAYLMDTDENEREKGKTVDYIYRDIKWKNNEMTIVDVPGHRGYVPNMVNGCSMANIAVVIVSARKGEYESGLKGQTIEHIVIARGIGISTLIVVINKMDTIDWNIEEYKKIKESFTKKLNKLSFKTIEFVPISAYNGDNITKLREDASAFEVSKSLMDLIATIDYVEPTHITVPLDETHIVSTKFLYYNIPGLITAGLECIVHTKDKEYPATIMGLDNDKKPFITQLTNPKIPIDTIIKFNEKPQEVYTNLVVRISDETIGLARIIPDKKMGKRLQLLLSKMKAKKIEVSS